MLSVRARIDLSGFTQSALFVCSRVYVTAGSEGALERLMADYSCSYSNWLSKAESDDYMFKNLTHHKMGKE